MVAPSFQSYKRLSEPYEINKKFYIDLEHPTTYKKKTARWYTEAEYKKLYPGDAAPATAPTATNFKKLLGFDKGYITVFKGINDLNEDWFQRCNLARYHVQFGWYIVSTDEVPIMLPEGVEPKKLNWEEVGNDDNSLKNRDIIQKAVESLIYDISESEFVGKVGERLDLTVKVAAAIPLTTQYGHSTMYIMNDEDNNEFIWTTSGKVSLTPGCTYNLRGTIKEQRCYKGRKQNNLTRCTIKED